MTQDIQLLISENRGIYIPQLFCQNYLHYVTNQDELKDQINDCLEGPDNEFYFESWDDITQQAKLKDDNGEPMTIGYLGESGDFDLVLISSLQFMGHTRRLRISRILTN